jgi:hypothetical protein
VPLARVPLRHRPDPDDGYSLLPLDVTDDLNPAANALYYASATFIESGDFDGAITYFDEVLAAAPGHPIAWRLQRKMKAEQARRLEIASLPSVRSRLLGTLGARTRSLEEQAKMDLERAQNEAKTARIEAKMARERERIEAKMARERERNEKKMARDRERNEKKMARDRARIEAKKEAMLREYGPAIDSVRRRGACSPREKIATFAIDANNEKLSLFEILGRFSEIEQHTRDAISQDRSIKAANARRARLEEELRQNEEELRQNEEERRQIEEKRRQIEAKIAAQDARILKLTAKANSANLSFAAAAVARVTQDRRAGRAGETTSAGDTTGAGGSALGGAPSAAGTTGSTSNAGDGAGAAGISGNAIGRAMSSAGGSAVGG